MMNATISVVCYQSKTLKNGEHPLMLRICKDNKKKYQSLGISVNPKYWDFVKNKPKPNCPNREQILKIILDKQAKLQSSILEYNTEDKSYTGATLLNAEKNKFQQKTVKAFYMELLEQYKNENKCGNRLIYKGSLNSLTTFTRNRLLQNLTKVRLTETQFAQIVGRMRLYQALPSYQQRRIPKLLITDSQINNVCRDYYNNPNFGAKNSTISMFDFHNLLTEANKSSYINDYVQRGINATEVTVGICKALQGDSEYSWFLG